jgi:superfamily II DNA or RNA helicase
VTPVLEVDFETIEVEFDEAPARPKFRLRDYQCGWVQKFNEDRKIFSRILLVACTGSGKTTFFAAVASAEWAHGGRTLVLENRDKLVRQTANRIAKETGLECEIEMAGEHASPFAPVVVASVQTLCRDGRLMGFSDNHFSLVVVDESHHALSKSFQKVLNYFHFGAESLTEEWKVPEPGVPYQHKAIVLGVTATPELGSKQSLGEFYQKQCAQYDYLQAVRDGWLVPPTTKSIPLKVDLRGLRAGRTPNGSDFKAGELSQRMIPVLEALADQVCEHCTDRKGIVFLPSIECARLFSEAVTRKGLLGIFVSGECLDVDEKTEDFVNAGPGTILSNACLYVEGADFPDVSLVCCARATKSVGFYKQIIGRGTRVLPGVVDGLLTPELRRAAIAASAKRDLLILDPLWRHDFIDLCDAYDLFTDKPEVKAKMKAAGAPSEEVAREAERDFIKALEKEAKKHARKAARTIDPLAWAVSLGDDALKSYVPESGWESAPPTAGQLDFIRKQGMATEGIKYKGLASKVIGRLMTRINLHLATPGQLTFLHQLGVDEQTAATLTMREASDLLDRRLKEKRASA